MSFERPGLNKTEVMEGGEQNEELEEMRSLHVRLKEIDGEMSALREKEIKGIANGEKRSAEDLERHEELSREQEQNLKLYGIAMQKARKFEKEKGR